MAREILNGDTETARRIERAEAANHAAYVAAVARRRVEIGASTLAVGSGLAAFAGRGNPLTQAFGLGFDGPVEDVGLDLLFEFYESRGAAVAVEVCNLADRSLPNALIARGCRVEEYTHVLALELAGRERTGGRESARQVEEADLDEWCDVVTRGFTGEAVDPELRELLRFFHEQDNSACFGAWRDGRMVGGGSVFFLGDIAILGGTSTIPEARGQGAQRDLLGARLDLAAERGASLAVISTEPGTTSQRNSLRAGFAILYARTKYVLGPR